MEFFQFTSTWLVVVLTWTRVFAIMFPFGIYGHYNNSSGTITITILICVSFIISLTKLYSGGKNSNFSTMCYVRNVFHLIYRL